MCLDFNYSVRNNTDLIRKKLKNYETNLSKSKKKKQYKKKKEFVSDRIPPLKKKKKNYH